MSKEAPGMDVSILGRQFRVACTEDEKQELQKAVSYLDAKMREIRDSGKVIGVERIAIMAALNMAHELLSVRVGGVDLGEVRRRMSEMRTRIDEVLAAQDELF
ncbi:MAG: cell division protein ZapA [Betaproteobacteria bacterium SG8_40]|jgi:cell division protein ZapA|nr:MAG: cell division protein ZapA [Betaproteobacteria bacterium SG8_40]